MNETENEGFNADLMAMDKELTLGVVGRMHEEDVKNLKF